MWLLVKSAEFKLLIAQIFSTSDGKHLKLIQNVSRNLPVTSLKFLPDGETLFATGRTRSPLYLTTSIMRSFRHHSTSPYSLSLRFIADDDRHKSTDVKAIILYFNIVFLKTLFLREKFCGRVREG